MNTKIVDIKELIMDKGLYPRDELDWRVAVNYANAMKTGAKFPAIVVGVITEKKVVKGLEHISRKRYVIDGWHRVDACKRNKITHIEAEVKEVASKNEIYLEAVRRNISHGKQFYVSEKIKIYVTLKGMGIDTKSIEQIIMTPIENIERMSAKRIAFTSSGHEVFLKPSAKSEAGNVVSPSFAKSQEDIHSGLSQREMLDDFILMLEEKIFDTNNPSVYGKLLKINSLLRELLKK